MAEHSLCTNTATTSLYNILYVHRLSKVNSVLKKECWSRFTSSSPDTAVPFNNSRFKL